LKSVKFEISDFQFDFSQVQRCCGKWFHLALGGLSTVADAADKSWNLYGSRDGTSAEPQSGHKTGPSYAIWSTVYDIYGGNF